MEPYPVTYCENTSEAMQATGGLKTMVLTRDFKEAIQGRIECDPTFREELNACFRAMWTPARRYCTTTSTRPSVFRR